MSVNNLSSGDTAQAQFSLSQTSVATQSQLPSHSIHELSRHKDLVFFDSKVEQIDTLMAGIKSAEVTVLDGDRNGITQISDVLKQHSNVSSVHIFSHGEENHVQFGKTSLSHDTLLNHQDDLKSWSQSLSEDADLLFYGCNVGQGNDGLAFVQQLSQLTQADVAASNDLTGNAGMEGDWELEVTQGLIEAKPPIEMSVLQAYQHSLAPTLGSNLVANGSFENADGAQEGNWTFISTLPNWTRTVGSTNIEVLRNTEGGASDGANFLELDADANYGIAQDIATAANKRYQISFAYSPDRSATATSNTMNVLWNGQQIAAVAESGVGLTTSWRTYTYEMSATSSTTRLEFQGAGTSDGHGALLDNVQVREILTTTDTSPPTASLNTSTLTTAGGSSYDFNVTYNDDTAVNVSTIDNTDILVTSPNGFSQAATLVSVSNTTNGTPRIATYRIAAPGGTWDSSDNSIYSVSLQANQVADTSNNVAVANNLGSIQVNIAASPSPDTLGSNLVANGSFENADGAQEGNWTFISTLPNWTRTVGSTNIEVLRNTEGGASDGANFLELDADANYGIAQDIATAANKRYQISFAYSPDRSATASSNTMNVLWNGQQIAAVAESGVGLTDTSWRTYTYEVSATGTSTRLEFQGAGTSDGHGPLLDNVQVRPILSTTGTIALEQNTYTVNEADRVLEFAVVRSENTSAPASVQYEISDGTAQLGTDFNGTDGTNSRSGTIDFAPNETRKTGTISIIDDDALETTETFTFLVKGPVGADLGTVRTATATILDDDNPALNISVPTFEENAGNAIITVRRSSGVGIASVDFTTANGTAIAGSDFNSTSGKISFAPGEINKTISIPLIDDNSGEPDERFIVNFTNPVGVTLDSQTQAIPVTIIDNDAGNFVRETVVSGLNQPTAFARTPNNELMFILEKSGIIKVAEVENNYTVLSTAFADLRQDVNDTDDRGALSIALHPNFYNGSPYIYVAYTYDPPEAYQNTNPNTDQDDPDGRGNRPARVVRLTADAATNYRQVVPNSQVVLIGKNSTWANTRDPDLNGAIETSRPESGRTTDGRYVQDYLKTDSTTHSVGHLAFGADGALYFSMGDGTSYNLDPRTPSTLELDSLSGKMLRVDPLTGVGLTDNPFFDGNPNNNRSKVWNSGLRNPFRFTFKPDTSLPFIGDVGWVSWEEVNVGTKGANFGWPAYEGGIVNGNVTNIEQPQYSTLNNPSITTLYGQSEKVTAPIYARNHSTGARAIIMGDFYDGKTFPSIYNGSLFVTDVNEGTVETLTIDSQNRVTATRRFASGVPGIVYMETGADGNLYYVNLFNNTIGRWQAD